MKKALAKAVGVLLYALLVVLEWFISLLARHVGRLSRSCSTRVLESMSALTSRNRAREPSQD